MADADRDTHLRGFRACAKAAFDAHLIGIDPDYRLHVSERLLVQNDGPMLEALKRLNGGTIHLCRTARRTTQIETDSRCASRRFKAAA